MLYIDDLQYYNKDFMNLWFFFINFDVYAISMVFEI